MKRSEILFGILRIPLDAAAIMLALLMAYWLREANIDLVPGMQFITKQSQLPPFEYYLDTFVTWSIVAFIGVLACLRLYALRSTVSPWQEIGRILIASGIWLAVIITWYFLVVQQLFFSRILLVHATVLSALFIIIGRIIVTLIQRAFLRSGVGVRSVVSIGKKALPNNILLELQSDIRFRYTGHCTSIDELKRHRPDLLLHTDPHPSGDETIGIVSFCRNHHIGYAFLPAVFADSPHMLSMQRLGLAPILRFEPTPLDGWGRVVKRMYDFLVALLLIIILCPILLLIALMILLTTGWPIFYISRRVGQFGEGTVPVIKFRTMINNAHARRAALKDLSHRSDGPLFKIKNDPRVTPIGRCLRRWSLDELPQLCNVLIGDMSLIGPRPHLPEEVEKYSEDQRRVFTVKPGITGLSQISGRSDIKFEDEVRLDLQYIEEWSLLFDVWIAWRTVVVVCVRKGAD